VRYIKRSIHRLLPATERLVIVGYSFPDADIQLLNELFVVDVLDRDLQLQVVNMANENEDDQFRARVQEVFGADRQIDFSVRDFRKFCSKLST